MRGDAGTPEARSQGNRVYRPRAHWLLLFAGLLGALGGCANLAFGLATANALNVVSALLVLPGAALMLLQARLLSIEIRPDGLAYRNMGFYTVYASWEDVERVAEVPLRFMGEVECILLRRSTVRGWTGAAWALPKNERGLTIPLGKNRSFWSYADDLRRDISYHARRIPG